MNLKEIKPGSSCKVVKVTAQGPLKRRILDMGITPGVKIDVVKTAPLGDPIEVNLRGYNLSLRGNEALNILVEV